MAFNAGLSSFAQVAFAVSINIQVASFAGDLRCEHTAGYASNAAPLAADVHFTLGSVAELVAIFTIRFERAYHAYLSVLNCIVAFFAIDSLQVYMNIMDFIYVCVFFSSFNMALVAFLLWNIGVSGSNIKVALGAVNSNFQIGVMVKLKAAVLYNLLRYPVADIAFSNGMSSYSAFEMAREADIFIYCKVLLFAPGVAAGAAELFAPLQIG